MTVPPLPPVPSLMAVFAHPDDESLSAGGVLAQQAARGARTAVVTTTWALGTVRAAELAQALGILGADAPRMPGYADLRVAESAPGRPRLCDVPLDLVVEDIVREIRAFRPEIVLTHDPYGGLTGHPDHVRTHRATLLAVHASGLEHLHPDAGAPWQPSALYLATHPHSAVRDLAPLLDRVGKSVLSVPDEHISTTVDVRPWLDRKWNAIRAHETELGRARSLPGLLSRLPDDVRDRILATEHFIRYSTRPTPGILDELTA